MGGCSCNGHTSRPNGCRSHTQRNGTCSGYTNTSGCYCHSTGGCTSHSNSCPSHPGYVGPRTITYTNIDVNPGEIIDLQDELEELQHELNVEVDRRGIGSHIDVLYGSVDASEIRDIRDLFITIVGGSPHSPYSDAEIAPSEIIDHTTVEAMKDELKSNTASTCACDCNYSCTCHCNYSCTCNCNYCTCHCNYCTCNCNYSCTCNCNYHSCSCNCNYSDSCFADVGYCSCDCNA